jgi:hypothetical protein
MSPEPEDTSVTGHVITTGTWRDWLPSIPRPVFALGARALYQVVLHGSGFSLPIAASEPARGFFTTFFVAAASRREAEEKARARVTEEWNRFGASRTIGPVPMLEVERIELLRNRFLWRSGGGFLLYNKELTE